MIKEFISKALLLKSPLTPLCLRPGESACVRKRGVLFLPLEKGGKEGFYISCRYYYKAVNIYRNTFRIITFFAI